MKAQMNKDKELEMSGLQGERVTQRIRAMGRMSGTRQWQSVPHPGAGLALSSTGRIKIVGSGAS